MTPSENGELHFLPVADDAERSVLGGLLLDPSLWSNEEVAVLDGEDFYSDKHRAIFRTLRSLDQRGVVVDAMVLTEALIATGLLDEAGGAVYVSTLDERCITTDSVPYFARVIRSRRIRRDAFMAAVKLIDVARSTTSELADVREAAAECVEAAERKQDATAWNDSATVVTAAYEQIERAVMNQGAEDGKPLGVLGRKVKMRDTEMHVLAARPGMGKTALALSVAEAIAFDGEAAGILSLEMPQTKLATRRLCARAGVPIAAAVTGNLSRAQMQLLARAAEELHGIPMFYEDAPGADVSAIRAKTHGLVRKAERRGTRLSLLVVDHIGKVKGKNMSDLRVHTARVSGALAEMAFRLQITVLALSQLNRACESRNPPKPRLDDMREAGQIEEDARAVWMLYRPEARDESTPFRGMGEVNVAKQNDGPCGPVWLPFDAVTASYDIFTDARPELERGGQW